MIWAVDSHVALEEGGLCQLTRTPGLVIDCGGVVVLVLDGLLIIVLRALILILLKPNF